MTTDDHLIRQGRDGLNDNVWCCTFSPSGHYFLSNGSSNISVNVHCLQLLQKIFTSFTNRNLWWIFNCGDYWNDARINPKEPRHGIVISGIYCELWFVYISASISLFKTFLNYLLSVASNERNFSKLTSLPWWPINEDRGTNLSTLSTEHEDERITFLGLLWQSAKNRAA